MREGHPGCCHTSSVGKEVSFCKHVAAVAAAGDSGDVDRFKEVLLAMPAIPARLEAIGTHTNRFGSEWATFVGEAQVQNELYAPGDCRVRSVDGASSSLSMTAYASAIVKFMLEGLEKQLTAVEASVPQRKAVWHGVAVHMNGVWAGQRLRNRVLETHNGQKLKYALDPFSESTQY